MITKETIGQFYNTGEITTLSLSERARSQATREALSRENYNPKAVVEENKEILSLLPTTPFREIGQKLVKGEALFFEQAFLGMTFVVAATNKGIFSELQSSFQEAHGIELVRQDDLRGPAQTFLTAMAQKETHGKLTKEEVAGMVACAMMDINVRLKVSPYVLETGGMGGDKGFMVGDKKKKVINASTLSAIVLSSLGIPVMKHGSYGNTSAVGSTEAVEALGVDIYQSSFGEIQNLFNTTGFYFSDAHIAKTIHDLSHSPFMRHETINHIIGPMTPPIDKETLLHKVIGVNEGVHPSLIAQAYELLHQKGFQRVGNVAVVSGLSEDFTGSVSMEDQRKLQPFMMLDEVSLYKTLLALVRQGKYVGCFVVSPEDFGCDIDPHEIQIVNTQEELLAANGEALKGLGKTNTDYLALNAAVGLFVAEYLDKEDAITPDGLNTSYLKECFQRCRDSLLAGQPASHLKTIIEVSKQRPGKEERKEDIFEDVDVIILDVDDTLVHSKDPDFYRQYSLAVDRAVAKYYGISMRQGKKKADYYRRLFGGGEMALLNGGMEAICVLYDEMCAINPSQKFERDNSIKDALQMLRSQGKKVVLLTDSPEGLSRRILAEAGFNPEEDFDMYMPFTREYGPRKMMQSQKVFATIAKYFRVPVEKVISIGDSVKTDIEPAQALGMKTCLVDSTTTLASVLKTYEQ